MTGITKPNWAEARRYADAETGLADSWIMFQVFDDKGQDDTKAEFRFGKLSDAAIQKWLIGKAKAGCGIFATVNKTDGVGRRRANMKTVRMAFVDLDGEPLPDKFPLEPHVIVESSRGRYHVGFFVNATDDFNAWSDVQARLAAYYNGDPKMTDPPRVLRLPGFDHQKKTPFRSRIVKLADPFELARYTLEQIADAHPCDYNRPRDREDGGRSEMPEGDWDNENDIERARDYLKAVEPPQEGNRNNEAYSVACKLNDFGISPELSFELMTEIWNERLDAPLPDREVRHVINSASRYKENAAGSQSTAAINEEFEDAEEFGENDLSSKPKEKLENIGGILSICAADIEMKNIDFLWPNRLALGVHTALAGIGGQGKSQIMYNVIATITTGGKWPDGTRSPKGRCIVLSAEEGRADMIAPRLRAAGADMSMVRIVDATATEGKGKNGKRKFNLQEDLNKLRKMCALLGDVKFIGFDPVSSYMGGDVDTHRNTAVRNVLDPITQAAEDIGCAVLSITHFNKGSSSKAIHRVMESAAFVNAPRASFGVFEDPDDPASLLLLQLKTNMEKAPGLRYSVKAKTVGNDAKGKPIRAPYIEWDVAPVTVSADDVVARQTERASPRLDEAIDLLKSDIAEGRNTASYIKSHASAEGIAPDTLRRAREQIGIRATPSKGKVPPDWIYSLPDEAMADEEF